MLLLKGATYKNIKDNADVKEHECDICPIKFKDKFCLGNSRRNTQITDSIQWKIESRGKGTSSCHIYFKLMKKEFKKRGLDKLT